MILNSNKNEYKIIVDDNCLDSIINQKWTITVKRGTPYAVMGKWIIDKTKMYYLHRLVVDAKKGEFVDHINGNTLDNRLCNLRICTNSENVRNQKISKRSKTGFKGVHFLPRLKYGKNPFSAKITINRKNIHLGYFPIAELAAKAYNQAAIKYHGEFARLNEIKD